ncbi:MAG: LysM peptidoglycan-binding domain-containing protein [Chloroflexi bacterium]|nr:LysM peptidoglycan-binding domain-containing protein [Chloroflexota bacterium]
MKESRGFTRPSLVMGLLFGFLALIAFGAALAIIYFRQQAQAQRAQFAPPIVLVTEPVSGAYVPAGTHLSVSATALGKSPITRVELWANGELKETQENVRPEGDSTFYAHFALLIPSEGAHFLTVHAVNALGIIGKSLPVGILVTAKSPPGEILQTVEVNPGETLEDIAKKYGSDAETLQKLNPPLKGQQPAAGAIVVVPMIPDQVPAPPQPPPPPPAIVVPPTITGPMLQPKTGGIDKFLDAIPVFALALIAPPAAPTNLQGQVDGCWVTLSWTDMAKDETRYEVWTLWMGITPRVVADLQPSPTQGAVWYRFLAPQTHYVQFWVEAVNNVGKQPSKTITLFIDPKNNCVSPQGSDSYLIVQVFEMTIKGNYDKVYCYVSHEGNKDLRIPEVPGDSIQVKAGKADFGGSTVGQEAKIFAKLIPVPQDGSLDVEGKCLGWIGQTLNDLGPFAGKFTVNEWDGARRSLKSGTYEIEFAVKPWTPAVEFAMFGKYSYEDPTLPAPWGLHMGNLYSPWATLDPRERPLSWNWDGDPKLITGFRVYLDGVYYKYFAGASTRSATVWEPAYCGHKVKWQVVAVSDAAQSPLSPALSYDLPKCQTYVMVKFETIKILDIEDGSPGPCDTVEAYYEIGIYGGVGKAEKKFGWVPSFGVGCTNCLKDISCGTYTFKNLGAFFSPKDPYADTIVVPVSTEDFWFNVGASFYDDDPLWDHLILYHIERFKFASLQEAQKELGCGKSVVSRSGILPGYEDCRSEINVIVTIYPNPCADMPPLGIPLPKPPWWP